MMLKGFLHRRRVSPNYPDRLPCMPCSVPRRTGQVRVVSSLSARPSPFNWRVGIHDFTFGACSSFTRVTACKVACPPKGGLCPEASARPVTRPSRSVATMPYRQLHGWILLPLVICAECDKALAESGQPANRVNTSQDARSCHLLPAAQKSLGRSVQAFRAARASVGLLARGLAGTVRVASECFLYGWCSLLED